MLFHTKAALLCWYFFAGSFCVRQKKTFSLSFAFSCKVYRFNTADRSDIYILHQEIDFLWKNLLIFKTWKVDCRVFFAFRPHIVYGKFSLQGFKNLKGCEKLLKFAELRSKNAIRKYALLFRKLCLKGCYESSEKRSIMVVKNYLIFFSIQEVLFKDWDSCQPVSFQRCWTYTIRFKTHLQLNFNFLSIQNPKTVHLLIETETKLLNFIIQKPPCVWRFHENVSVVQQSG